MIVWVDDLLFERNAHDVDRIALLRNAAIRRHTLIVSDDLWAARTNRKAPRFDSWKSSLSDRLRREVEELRERLDRVSGNSVHGAPAGSLFPHHSELMPRDAGYRSRKLFAR